MEKMRWGDVGKEGIIVRFHQVVIRIEYLDMNWAAACRLNQLGGITRECRDSERGRIYALEETHQPEWWNYDVLLQGQQEDING